MKDEDLKSGEYLFFVHLIFLIADNVSKAFLYVTDIAVQGYNLYSIYLHPHTGDRGGICILYSLYLYPHAGERDSILYTVEWAFIRFMCLSLFCVASTQTTVSKVFEKKQLLLHEMSMNREYVSDLYSMYDIIRRFPRSLIIMKYI